VCELCALRSRLQVEEARRKKFNGMVQAVSQTITVIPANMAAGGLQSIFHTCQIVGQPGLVLTQVSGGGSAVPVAAPITLTVASVPGNRPKAAEPSATESKTETLSAGAARGPDAAAAPSSSKPKKSKEQLAELKASYGRRQFATEAEISRLMQVTKLSKRAIKKWFSDTRYNQRNAKDHHGVPLGEAPPTKLRGARSGLDDDSGGASTIVVIDSSDDASDCSPPAARDPRVKFRHAFPDFTPQKFKEKTAEQLLVLEASYQGCSTPPDEELGRLRGATKLTRRELDAWFTERRKTPSKEEEEEDEEDEDESRSTPPSGRKSLKKTTEQLHFLKKAFVRSQWPTAAEYDVMAADSRLPRSYIVNWFGDTRYACKNSNLKWFYLYQSGKVPPTHTYIYTHIYIILRFILYLYYIILIFILYYTHIYTYIILIFIVYSDLYYIYIILIFILYLYLYNTYIYIILIFISYIYYIIFILYLYLYITYIYIILVFIYYLYLYYINIILYLYL